jgi:Tfp pilus assembly protein PilF
MHCGAAALGALAAAALAFGCAGSSSGPTAPDQQSVAEYDLAREAFENQKPREALVHINNALELDDENAPAAYLGTVILLGFCAQDARSSDCRYSEAERLARLALQADAELRDARNALGVILVHQGRYEEAIRELEPLAKDMIYGSPEKAWGNLGWAYLQTGRVDEAIPALKRAVAAQPSFCVGHYWLGLAYQKKSEHAAAREAFTRALEIPVGDCAKLQDAFAARAQSETALGLPDEARIDWEKCRDLAPSSVLGKRCANEVGTAP